MAGKSEQAAMSISQDGSEFAETPQQNTHGSLEPMAGGCQESAVASEHYESRGAAAED